MIFVLKTFKFKAKYFTLKKIVKPHMGKNWALVKMKLRLQERFLNTNIIQGSTRPGKEQFQWILTPMKYA